MSRQTTATLDQAVSKPGSYKFLSRAKIYPSRVFKGTFNNNNPVAGYEAIGLQDTQLPQDIYFNSTVGGLVTFYTQGNIIKYAKQGSGTPHSCPTYASLGKPAVFGSKLFLCNGNDVVRYGIDWNLIASDSATPFTIEVTVTLDYVAHAAHALSETEVVAICEDDGGYRIAYVDFAGPTVKYSDTRFMFPSIVEWDGNYRTMSSMAHFSAGAKLGTRIFAYMSSAYDGMVKGVYLDTETGGWSDIFTAIPTDLAVSLCQIRISNAFSRNGKIYMAGLLARSDAYESSNPYTLLMTSSDGLLFSIDRFSLVSNTGYRLIAHIGSNNNLYLANSNRVAYAPSTWVFDGDNFASSPVLNLDTSKIANYSVQGVSGLELNLKAGMEEYVDHPYIQEGSRVVLDIGYETAVGNEWVQYGSYIIDSIEITRTVPRSYKISCTHEGTWKMQGLSMPFYAEKSGVSSTYDNMKEQTGLLYAAPSNAKFRYNFYVDFWGAKGYENVAQNITSVNPVLGGGITAVTKDGAHKCGVLIEGNLLTYLGTGENPTITGTTLTAKIYGWSKPFAAGNPNDVVNLILVHTDADGKDEQTVFTAETKHWRITHPYQAPGDDPIEIVVSGLSAGRKIKTCGLIFEAPNKTQFLPWRIEFVDGVQIPITIPSTQGATWVKEDDGTFRIPGSGLPFVMFSQKPYNAFNFFLASEFTNSVSGGVVGYPVGVGLVGLAQDAKNFILAMFDKVSGKAKLIKIRDGVETVLAEATPSFVVGDRVSMQFIHRDGNFKIYIYDSDIANNKFKLVLEYKWAVSDGYMCTSVVSALKCGIYGAISAPMIQLLNFYMGVSDTNTRSDGIPAAPLGALDDFPDTGDIKVGEVVYHYESKIPYPDYIRGPSQLRQNGKYAPPFGNGSSGLQCLDLDWYANKDLATGKLIAISNGSVFKCSGSFWQPFITTARVKKFITDRSQHYSTNALIGTFFGTVAEKVWITGGFDGVSVKEGTPGYNTSGDYGVLQLQGTIKCHWFMGSGGDTTDNTIEDLTHFVCSLSGVKASYPGNRNLGTMIVDDVTDIYEDAYAESFDVTFGMDAPATWEVRTNVYVSHENYENGEEFADDWGSKVRVEYHGDGRFTFIFRTAPTQVELLNMEYTSTNGKQFFRVLYHENSVSLFHNGKWIMTVATDKLNYDSDNFVDVDFYTDEPITFNDVVVHELSENREAIYIDLETEGNSAIGSIIQERPIEVVPLPDGGYEFYYEKDRDTVGLVLAPKSHKETLAIPNGSASDAIVYGSHDVKTLQFPGFAEILGLSTRLFRYPDLNLGSVEAAIRTQNKSFARRRLTEIVTRPQPALLVGDIVSFNYTLAEIGTVVTGSIIVEGINFSYSNLGEVQDKMSIVGREAS